MLRYLRVLLSALALALFLLSPVFTAGERPVQALDSVEHELLRLLNQHRAGLGLPRLMLSPKLTRAATWLSSDMASKGYFSHTDSLGRTASRRMGDFGYGYNTWRGENISAGREHASTTLTSWLASEGHRWNIENPHYYAIGIARVYDAHSPYKWYWTTNFGGIADTRTTARLSNYHSIRGDYFLYHTGSTVKLTGNVDDDYPGEDVSVHIQRYTYTSQGWVWSAYRSTSVKLASNGGFSLKLSPPAGKYRLRAYFDGDPEWVRPSGTTYRFFAVR